MEVSDESPGDEDVAGEAGDDDGGWLAVVGGADGDGVFLVDVADAVVDGDSVDAGGSAEGSVCWSCFGGLFPDGGGGFASYGSVGPLVVVVVTEDIELGLEFFDGGGSRLGLKPFLQGQLETFHFPLGLRVVGASVAVVDTEDPDRVGQADLVDVGIVSKEPCRPPPPVGARREGSEYGVRIDCFGCFETGTHPGAVVDDRNDLQCGVVGEVVSDVVDLPAFVGPVGDKHPIGVFRCLIRFGSDEPPPGEDPPDRRL